MVDSKNRPLLQARWKGLSPVPSREGNDTETLQGQELPKQTWGVIQQVQAPSEIFTCWSEEMIVHICV